MKNVKNSPVMIITPLEVAICHSVESAKAFGFERLSQVIKHTGCFFFTILEYGSNDDDEPAYQFLMSIERKGENVDKIENMR